MYRCVSGSVTISEKFKILKNIRKNQENKPENWFLVYRNSLKVKTEITGSDVS